MNTKKSLGHFPFGSDAFEKTELAFIPDINGEDNSSIDEIETSPFDATPSDIKKRLDNKATLDTTNSEIIERDIPDVEDNEPVKKKVASYYIEETLINRMKAYSDAVNASYSAVTSDAIEIFISKRGY